MEDWELGIWATGNWRLEMNIPSTLLISPAPKPVKVRLCFGLVNPGPTGPCRSWMGAEVEGRRSLAVVAMMESLCKYQTVLSSNLKNRTRRRNELGRFMVERGGKVGGFVEERGV